MGHRRSGAQDGLLGYCYERSPICVPDGSAPIPIERRDFVAAARPGTRAPHAWLGEGRSTLDLFGDGFVLLRFGGQAMGASLAEAAARRGVPLRLVDIADHAIAALYERNLVLVRPDGHVAWRGDEPPANADALIDRVRGAPRPGERYRACAAIMPSIQAASPPIERSCARISASLMTQERTSAKSSSGP